MEQNNFEFIEDPHQYLLNGQELPHWTRVANDLGIVDLSFVNKELLEFKRQFGTSGHEITRKWDQGSLDIVSMNPAFLSRLENWIQFKDDYGIEILGIEWANYSSIWKVGVKIDRVLLITKGEFKNRIAIVDQKFGSYLVGVEWQTALYLTVWNERNPDRKATVRFCVQLNDNGYKVEPYTNKQHEKEALTLLQAYKIKHRNGR